MFLIKIIQGFEGKGGREGIGGSFRLGMAFPIVPNKGFGGGIKEGAIPPFARGIEGALLCCGFLSEVFEDGGINVGILLMALGLFYARSLSAYVPCFSPLESFLTAYSTLICLPEKYCPFICEIARSEELKLS